MKSRPAFDAVRKAGLSLPDVQFGTRYDGSPVLKLHGCFLAGLATHPSAEADTLVVRMEFDERALMLEDAPETYYVTDYYRPYPVVLVRLRTVGPDAISELLRISWRLTKVKAGGSRRRS